MDPFPAALVGRPAPDPTRGPDLAVARRSPGAAA
jgi:hypothetical protein